MAKKKIKKEVEKKVANKKSAPKKSAPKKVVAKKPIVKKPIVKKLEKKKTKVTKTKDRKPSKITILAIKNDAEQKLRELRKKEKPFIRYSFHIDSIEVNESNIIEEILYTYRGTIIIPKSQKENYKQGSAEVGGVYLVNKDINSIIAKADYRKAKRSDIIILLNNNIRKGHLEEMQSIISKELMSNNKKIDKLPWKY